MKWFSKKNDKQAVERREKLREELMKIIEISPKIECDELADYLGIYEKICGLDDFLIYMLDTVPKMKRMMEMQNITYNVSKLRSIYTGDIESLNLLITQEKKVTEEIIQYSDAVRDMQEKYKLSMDWGGKKPHMINLGKQLNKKRESCLVAEKAIRDKLNPLNQAFEEVIKTLQEQYTAISTELHTNRD